MSLLTGTPHVHICNKCGWKSDYVIKSDMVPYNVCPKCKTHLSLKRLSDLSILDRLKYAVTKGQF